MADQKQATQSRQPRTKQASAANTRNAQPAPVAPPPSSGGNTVRTLSFSAVLIFLGSLLGTLLGTFTSINDLFESFNRVETLLNPPAQVCVVGSGTILGEGLGMAAAWEAAYEANTDNIDVNINATGSLAGVDAAVAGDCVHVLAMSEALPSSDYRRIQESGREVACAAEIGYDIVAFISDINNPVSTLLERRMSSILTGRITNWDEVGGEDQTITIYARPGSGTTDYVLKQFRYPAGAEVFPPNANYIECASNSECLDRTLATPGALYWVSTSWMHTQPEQYLRVLPILQSDERPINPLRDDFRIREYPRQLVRPLYMYVLSGEGISAEQTAQARDFLRYVRSVSGQQVIEENFFYTYFDQPRDVPLDFPPGFSTDTSGPRDVCRDGSL